MLRLAVCDDNADEMSDMLHFINQYRTVKNFNCNYAAFSNGMDLVSALEKGKRFDIYCMDIILPGFTGIETAKEIRRFDKTAPIIFFSSSPEFALESYSVKAVNYVLKPLTKEKLFAALDEVVDQINDKKEEAIIVKSKDGIQRILISNLVFAKVIGRHVFYHLRSGKVIECSDSFSCVSENLLKHRSFVKPHRAFIVNMQYIDKIQNNNITLQTLSTIPIAQGKARKIKQQYLDYQTEEEP